MYVYMQCVQWELGKRPIPEEQRARTPRSRKILGSAVCLGAIRQKIPHQHVIDRLTK
jgi:hypothetical protein